MRSRLCFLCIRPPCSHHSGEKPASRFRRDSPCLSALFSLGLTHHEFPAHCNYKSEMQRSEIPVGLLQLLPDRQALGTVLLAFPASDALTGKRRFLCKGHSLDVLTATSPLRLGVHCIPASENTGNIHSFRTGHAVTASRASDLFIFADLIDHFLQCGKIFFRK